jgi:mannose-6-phosphate isomerase-like protein (cupin superfamily)
MYTVIRSGDLSPSAGGTVRFEGESYGSGVSLFLMHSEPGKGPGLHRHPYSETWIVRAGRARFSADGEYIEVGPGDILVAGPHTVHGFKNVGTEPADIICIHASPRIIQEWLED